MEKIVWRRNSKIVQMSAHRTLGSIIERLRRKRPDWVVLIRTDDGRERPFRYAFRPREVFEAAKNAPLRLTQRAIEALELHETDESPVVQPGVETHLARRGASLPSASRALLMNPDGEVISVGEVPSFVYVPKGRATDLSDDELNLGFLRGKGSSNRGNERLRVMLSAEAPSVLAIGEEAIVTVGVGLGSEVLPFAVTSIAAIISPDEKIAVMITVQGGAVELLAPRLLKLAPPRAKSLQQSAFIIRGLSPGLARIAIIFRQGGTELGTLTFAVNVAASMAASTKNPVVRATVDAAPRHRDDDDILMLLIDEELLGGARIRYRYRVVSSVLGMDYEEFFSEPLLTVDGGDASTTRDYVESIYRQVTERVLLNSDDVKTFERELHAIGISLCRQLFPDDFARQLWEKRNDIGGVLIRSWEPYIPWELLRLRHPKAPRTLTDERFLAEYDLVRSLNGRTRPRQLSLRDWSYVAANYEFGYAKQVGSEIEYLTNKLPRRYGIAPTPIRPGIDYLLDALNDPDFDVLHLACHGEAIHNDIERSCLIIGDRSDGGTVVPISIEARTVRAEADLWERKPLVFLNACESGRSGASLTEWGGWPQTFWETGAGAFVGTSWPVRERPARVFAENFYEALLEGLTLAQAGGAGRAAAKKLGDASWLAYKVYGQPGARKA